MSATQGNKSLITWIEIVCWVNVAGKQAKEFLFFSGFLSVTPLYYSISFSCTNKTGMNKTKAFSNHGFNASKNIFLLFCDYLSFTPSLLCPVSFFLVPGLMGIIKHGRLKPQPFLTMVITQTKIFLLFYNCFSFIHSVLCFVFHAPYTNAIGKLLNSLLLLASFFVKPTDIFSIYSPEVILLVTVILRNEKYKKNTCTKGIVKIINN